MILMQRLVQVDNKVRTDPTFPAGFMDVIKIEKTNELFRLLFDVKGRFMLHRITPEEAKYKLCRVKKVAVGHKATPYLVTHDGRTIRFPDPDYKVSDTVKVDLDTGKIIDHIGFDVGNLCMITSGHNVGRVGVITNKEKHPGAFDIIHVKDAAGAKFATRSGNVFVIGKGLTSLVSLPRQKGVRLTILQEMERREKQRAKYN